LEAWMQYHTMPKIILHLFHWKKCVVKNLDEQNKGKNMYICLELQIN
jgi:hypothetical protein